MLNTVTGTKSGKEFGPIFGWLRKLVDEAQGDFLNETLHNYETVFELGLVE